MCQEEQKCIPDFSRKSRRKRDKYEDLNTDGKLILQCYLQGNKLSVWTDFIGSMNMSSGGFQQT
jgi:hypothetical protein